MSKPNLELLLDRDIRTRNTTIGVLYVDGKFECFTLEDRDRGLTSSMSLDTLKEKKVYGKTAIPEGRYSVGITYSPTFKKKMPLINGVPGYSAVRIHPGNDEDDTLGCILPGTSRAIDWVSNSRNAFNSLWAKIEAAHNNGQKIYITVKS